MAPGLRLSHLILAGALAFSTAPAFAQSLIDQARASGSVGEQADGYLGVVSGASVGADIKALVDQINIKRKAAYTELAGKTGVTVAEAGAATGCKQLATKVKAGDYYRDDKAAWKKSNGSVSLPSYCPAS